MSIISRFKGYDLDKALRLRRKWFSQICWALGLKIEKFGQVPKNGGLLVSNHRSYFDPILIMSEILALPVGKTEVQNWPIIGWGAKISGTVFVDRKSFQGRKKARKSINEMLQKGYSIVNFPEGTTHTQAQTLAFKPGMFKDAAKASYYIYPIALDYQKTSDAWVGDDTFLRHFFECFGKKYTYVRIFYGKAIQADDADKLLIKSKRFIDEHLSKIRNNWHEENLKTNDATS